MKEVKQGQLVKVSILSYALLYHAVVARKCTSSTTVCQDWEIPRGCMTFNWVTRNEHALFSPLLFLAHTLHKPAISATLPLLSPSIEHRDMILDSSPLIYIHPGYLPPQYGLSLAGFSFGTARSDLEKRLFSTSIPIIY
ncbi:hypothetical protein F5888DRAFT_85320 [Russula emetica]|nr:hypothetical protein F5888DRAFT_85320 [Russula emetica]